MRLLGRGDVIAPCKSSDDEDSPDVTQASAAALDDGLPPPPTGTDLSARSNQARPKLHAMLLKEDAQQQQQQGHGNSIPKKKAGMSMSMGIAGTVKNRFAKGGSGKQEQAQAQAQVLPGIATAKRRSEPAGANVNVARKPAVPATSTTTGTAVAVAMGSTNPRAPKKRGGPTTSSPTHAHALPNGDKVLAASTATPAVRKERAPTISGRQSLSPRNALVPGRGFLHSPDRDSDGRTSGASPRFIPRKTPTKSKSGELGTAPSRAKSGDGQGRSKSGELGVARPLVFEVKRNPGPGTPQPPPGMHDLHATLTPPSSSSKFAASASAPAAASYAKSGGAVGALIACTAPAVWAAGIAMDTASGAGAVARACSPREDKVVPQVRKKAAVLLNLQDLEAGRGTDFDAAQYDFAPGQPDEVAPHAQDGRPVQSRARGRASPASRPSRTGDAESDSDSDGGGGGGRAFDPFCIPAGDGEGPRPGMGTGGATPTKPHKANDPNWEAVRSTRSRDGSVGLSHFSLLKRLGSGDIGSVYLAELRGTACYFAMKVMDKGALENRKKQERAQTEREILESLDHPFLPTLYAHFDTPQFSCLVMEFCPGGDLHSLRQAQHGKRFFNSAARFYAAEVLLALEYLHMMGVVYRDLKPENVLVRKDGHIMLSDFDLSLKCDVSPTLLRWDWNSSSTPSSPMSPLKRAAFSFSAYNHHVLNLTSCIMPTCRIPSCSLSGVPGSPRSPRLARRNSGASSTYSSSGGGIGMGMGLSGSFRRRHVRRESFSNQVVPLPELVAEPTEARSMSFVGTHEYLAPEIISGEGHGSAVDWWTFGIFLFELLYGKTPFRGADNQGTLRNVLTQALRFPEEPGSEEVQDDEEDDDVVCQDAKALIRGLLAKDPHKRLGSARGAAEIKAHPFFHCVNWALIRCATPPEVPRPFRPPDSVSTVGGRTPPSSPVAATGEALGVMLDPGIDFGDVF